MDGLDFRSKLCRVGRPRRLSYLISRINYKGLWEVWIFSSRLCRVVSGGLLVGGGGEVVSTNFRVGQ